MFVVNTDRQKVLTGQLDALNEKYAAKKPDPKDPDYGLLDPDPELGEDSRRYLNYKVYAKAGEHNWPPEDSGKKSSLVLVHFSDRILNYKAEEIKMKVHLHDMY